MQPQELQPGDIMQLNPTANGGLDWFGGCLFVVTDAKSWGAQGYVKSAGASGNAFFRAKFADMEPTGGKVVWEHEING